MAYSGSQMLTSWVRPAKLRDLLRQAIDGGQNLRSDLWHPLRSPVWHSSIAVSDNTQAQLRHADPFATLKALSKVHSSKRQSWRGGTGNPNGSAINRFDLNGF